MRMFRELCGSEVLPNVVLVSTMWDIVDFDLSKQREDELRNSKFWQPLINGGGQVALFRNSIESGEGIVKTLGELGPVKLRIQVELVDERKALVETDAGKVVDANLVNIAEESRQILVALEKESATDSNTLMQIKEEMTRYKEELKNIKVEMRRLRKKPFWKKVGNSILRLLKLRLRNPNGFGNKES